MPSRSDMVDTYDIDVGFTSETKRNGGTERM
jgi:hypothetical protein